MKVGIIGGGAAGMMCAATINEQNTDIEVFLFEKNPSLGKKVLISGGGRCNVTTGIEDVKTVLQKYPRGGKFLTSAMYNFPPGEVRAWFESHDVPLNCEDDLRVFPVSDHGTDVVGAFEKIFTKLGTKILTNFSVQKIEFSKNKFSIHDQSKEKMEVDALVVAVGGQAFRHTGSTGDGYSMAESLGHHVTTLAPSLHSFILAEKWPRQLSGVSFKDVTISAGQKPEHFRGPFLFTHSGISGPAVFAISSLVAFEEFDKNNPLPLTIDYIPDISVEALTKMLIDLCQVNAKQNFKNVLHQFVPRAFAEVICDQEKISLTKKCATVTKNEIKQAVAWLKRTSLHAILRGAGDEFVTAGGVKLSEIDERTMESRLCPNLYFVGEVLNIDGFTGGFNLQAAWATGRMAGESISN